MSTTDSAEIRVLHVDDEREILDVAATFLERADERFAVTTATSPAEAREVLADEDVDCVVCDHDMPRETGIEFLRWIREEYGDLPFVLYTGKGSEEIASEAITAGVSDYLQKGSGKSQYAVLANRIENVVSAHRSATAADRERHRLEQILKTVPECIVQIDRSGEFTFANQRAREVLGIDPDALTGRTYNDPEWDITDLDGEPIPDGELPFRQVVDSGEPVRDRRHTVEWPDGTRKTLQVNGAPLFGEGGEVVSTIFSLSDITDRRQRERELRREQERFRALSEAFPDVAFFVSENGRYLEVLAGSASPLLLDDPDALIGQRFHDVLPDAEADRFQAVVERVAESGEADTVEYELDVQAGTRWFEARVAPLETTTDEGRSVVWVARDVTHHKDREADLSTYEYAVQSALSGISIADFDGTVTVVNPALLEMWGFEEDSAAIGRNLASFWQDPDDARTAVDAIQESGHWSGEFHAERTDGTTFVARAEASIVTDEDDEPVAMMSSFLDVTERREREQRLERQNERLEEFAGIVSHDLRSPLNVATSRLELAREEVECEHHEPIATAHERMETLIDDLLEVATAGESGREVGQVDLAAAVERAARYVDASDLTIRTETDLVIQADQGRLGQLLENLLRNAAQHGGSRVTVGDTDSGFFVADDGPGIPPGEREAVFESGYSTVEDGTGLGLDIVEEIATDHGWTVTVTEGTDDGARFEFDGVDAE